MTDGVAMETEAVGGLAGGFKRMLGGGSAFLNSFSYSGQGTGQVSHGRGIVGVPWWSMDGSRAGVPWAG